MKNVFPALLLLLLLGGGHWAHAQSTVSITTSQDQPEAFTIVDATSGTTTTWYIEKAGISNEIGEQIAPISGDTRTTFLTQLEQYRNDSRVSQFNLDTERNTLTIAMTGKSANQLFTALKSGIQTSSNK